MYSCKNNRGNSLSPTIQNLGLPIQNDHRVKHPVLWSRTILRPDIILQERKRQHQLDLIDRKKPTRTKFIRPISRTLMVPCMMTISKIQILQGCISSVMFRAFSFQFSLSTKSKGIKCPWIRVYRLIHMDCH